MSFFKQLFATRKTPYKPWANQRDRVEINLSGTRLSMELPPHSNIEGFTRDPAPESVDIYDGSLYQSDEHLLERQREGSSIYSLFSRNWDFRGRPWRDWPFGDITFAATISRYDSLPSDMSCFNPEHLERVALRKAYFGGPAKPEYSEVVCPVNWRLVRFQDNTGIYFEFHAANRDENTKDADRKRASITSCLLIPIERRLILQVYFSFIGYSPAEFSLANMTVIRDEVLSTIKCELSDTATSELHLARNKWPNATAQETRAIEPWRYPVFERDTSTFGAPLVQVAAGSPPPDLVV